VTVAAGSGPAPKRNAAWRAGGAPLVAFTDDDCRPEPGWLAAGLAANAHAPEAVVQGRTVPDPDERHRQGPYSRTLAVERLGPWFETCNIFYPRELLERLDGFDEAFGSQLGGEDTDLAWRAIELGRPTVFAGDAVVRHAVEDLGPIGKLRVAARWREMALVYARHPATRAELDHLVFWNLWHYLLVRSLLALLLPRRLRPLRAAILARHGLALARRSRDLSGGPWLLPFLVLHDLIETLAVARGAVRHRVLVL
jgi:GT2 family glycosyltransferase